MSEVDRIKALARQSDEKEFLEKNTENAYRDIKFAIQGFQIALDYITSIETQINSAKFIIINSLDTLRKCVKNGGSEENKVSATE